MKRNAQATVRRTLRRASTWRPKSAGKVTLNISRLISPLRYDVQVRVGFFDLLAEREGRLSEARLHSLAWDSPYGEWFRAVAMPRFRPWVLHDPAVARETFQERVRSAQALRVSFLKSGFDHRTPVTLRSTRSEVLTESGIFVNRRLHVGDGGHRLALLLHSGQHLSPQMYRIDSRGVPPIDNTAVLLHRLQIRRADYVRFLGHGYSDSLCTDLDQLREVAMREQPDLVRELESVIAVHIPLTGE